MQQATTLAPDLGTAALPLPRPRWWREVAYTVVLYLVYSSVRNLFGSNGGPTGHANGIAYGHALDIIEAEKFVNLFFEPHLQDWYLQLPARGWIEFWNVFYGTAHFVVTALALIWLFRRRSDRYPKWRNTLAMTTLLALIGFAAYSLMPPRLLSEPANEFGPPRAQLERDPVPGDADFVDTLAVFPTFWSFDSGSLKTISNQYAAMPSLHIGWSVWSALVLVPMLRRRWAKALAIAHPVATLFCIVVTGNHYWLDAAGGLAILAGGYLLGGRLLTELWARFRRSAAPVPA